MLLQNKWDRESQALQVIFSTTPLALKLKPIEKMPILNRVTNARAWDITRVQ